MFRPGEYAGTGHKQHHQPGEHAYGAVILLQRRVVLHFGHGLQFQIQPLDAEQFQIREISARPDRHGNQAQVLAL